MNDAIVTIATVTIPSVLTLIGCMVNNNLQREKERHAIELNIQEIKASNQQTVAVIEERIQTLSDHVNKHNNLVERMYNVENKTDRLQYAINDLREDIKGMEGDHK